MGDLVASGAPMASQILIVEDDPDLAGLVREHLESYGFGVSWADGRGDVLAQFEETQPALVLLDIGLPGKNGFYWCDRIREVSACPILFVSAQSGESDQVLALMRGGDDLIPKPFSLEVLVAKIHAQLRRAYGDLAADQGNHNPSFGDVTLDERKMTLSTSAGTTELSKTELQALRLLITNGDEVVTRAQLQREVWDTDTFIEANTVSVTIGRLRKKLDQVGSTLGLRAIRGVGYLLEEPTDTSATTV